MADSKISNLPAATTPLAGTEVLPIVQSSTTKKVAVSDLTAGRNVSAANLTATGTLAVTGASTLEGLTVGKGAGAVSANTAVGVSALAGNSSGTRMTAVGYRAMVGATGNFNAAFGSNAFESLAAGTNGTAIGDYALQQTTGSFNTAIGNGSGYLITSGAKNSILGIYNGNQGGLDIRTASNYIVLSDGDGNPRMYFNAAAGVIPGTLAVTGAVSLATANANSIIDIGSTVGGNATAVNIISNNGGYNWRVSGSWFTNSNYEITPSTASGGTTFSTPRFVIAGATGNVRMSAYGAGAATFDASGNITSVSDESLKRDVRPYTRGLAEILAMSPILHGYTEDSGLDQSRDDYVSIIAQNTQGILPEAIGQNADGKLSYNPFVTVHALVNAVKELQAQIDELTKGQALKAKPAALTDAQIAEQRATYVAATEARMKPIRESRKDITNVSD